MMLDYGVATEFRDELLKAYRKGKERINYKASVMLDILSEKDYISKIESLLNKEGVSYGFSVLYPDNLDLTIEYIVLYANNGIYKSLFSDEVIEKCKKRIKPYMNKHSEK